MADKDQFHDEYHFDDLDALNPELDQQIEHGDEATEKAEPQAVSAQSHVKRNALIVVGIFLIILVIYKIASSIFSNDTITKTSEPVMKPLRPVSQVAQPVSSTITTTETTPAVVDVTETTSAPLQQKLTTIEQNQQNVHNEVVTINNQMTGVNNNVHTIMMKMNELNQIIAQLNQRVDSQSQMIEHLVAKARARRKPPQAHLPPQMMPKLFLQAIIPGRAWLIATNGATLTVREGTVIPGRGVVRMIDPLQGRVTLSSGQVIRFSQDDS